MQPSVTSRPSLLPQPSSGVRTAPEAHPVNATDLAVQLKALSKFRRGVLVWQLEDLRDVRSLRLLDLNEAAERALGASVREAIGKVIAETFPALLKTDLPDRCRTVIASGQPESVGEVRYSDSGIQDSVFWFECFPLPGNCVGTTFENITARKRSEQTNDGRCGSCIRLLWPSTVRSPPRVPRRCASGRYVSKSVGPWAACLLPMNTPRRSLCPTPFGILATLIDSRAFGKLPKCSTGA